MWQQRTHVPKFGNWENEENVPYTAYFDKARKGRTGTKMINPNDPEENPDILSDHSTSVDTSLANQKADGGPKPAEHGAVRPAHESRRSKEDNDLKFANSPVNNHNNLGRRPSSELANQRHGSAGRGAVSGDTHRRAGRQSTGSEQSIEKSPLHRHARAAGRDSPSWEGKSSHEGSHVTPARSRLKPRGDETVNILFLLSCPFLPYKLNVLSGAMLRVCLIKNIFSRTRKWWKKPFRQANNVSMNLILFSISFHNNFC